MISISLTTLPLGLVCIWIRKKRSSSPRVWTKGNPLHWLAMDFCLVNFPLGISIFRLWVANWRYLSMLRWWRRSQRDSFPGLRSFSLLLEDCSSSRRSSSAPSTFGYQRLFFREVVLRALNLCVAASYGPGISKKGIFKVAWSMVCLPEEKGELGLRNFTVWNRVLCLKFIWLLLSKSPSLWAEWHWNKQLREQSFWIIEPLPGVSWTWRKLLQLRLLALQFSKMKLGNGRTASF